MVPPPPDDIMLLIFSQLVQVDDAEDKWPAMIYDHHAAQLPFTLAAVCQRWRGLALATSTLWTYFGFPPANKMKGQHLKRLELLRQRAGTAPIDVVFGWHRNGGAEACRRDASHSVFEAILELQPQWKTVVLQVEGSTQGGWTMSSMSRCSQWPLLESLSLSMDGISTTLPAAPRLHRFWLDCGVDLNDEYFIVGGYPSLSMLSIFCGSTSFLQRLFSICRNQLVELVLVDDLDGFDDDPGRGLTRRVFPVLLHLTLDDAGWLQCIDAPALKKLLVTYRRIEDVAIEALCRFDHIQELQLCGGIFGAHMLAHLDKLSDITTLAFCSSRSLNAAIGQGRDYYGLDTRTLRELTSLNPHIWPRLQRLQFAWFDRQLDTGKNAVDAQDLLDFVSARNAKRAGSHHGQETARIVEVLTNYPGAPDWLEDELRKLIVVD